MSNSRGRRSGHKVAQRGPALASRSDRLRAGLFDTFAVFMLSGLVNWGVMTGWGFRPRVFMIVFAAIWALDFVVLTGLTGQTLGKQANGIRVVSVDGGRARWSQVLRRESLGPVLRFIPRLGVPASIGARAWFLVDPQRQGLHDLFASTIVVEVGAPHGHRW